MAIKSAHPRFRPLWVLGERQHDVVERGQLLEMGFTPAEIAWALRTGRLHHTPFRGVYALGTPSLTQPGEWMAAVLGCGPGAALSHRSAAAFLEIGAVRKVIEVSIPVGRSGRHNGVLRHRRAGFLAAHTEVRDGISMTSPALTIIDLAPRSNLRAIDAIVNEADGRNLVSVGEVRETAASLRCPGARKVLLHLDRRTFRLTRSELERDFLPIADRAGLPIPETSVVLNGWLVDFWIPQLGMVVEADSHTWHRTPAQQARDTEREHSHLAAGVTPVRFSYEQIHFEPEYVEKVLRRVAERCRRTRVGEP